MILLALMLTLSVTQRTPVDEFGVPLGIQTATPDSRYRPTCRVSGHFIMLSSGSTGLPNRRTLRWELYNGGNTPVLTGDVQLRRSYLQQISFSSSRVRGRIPDHSSCRAGVIQSGARR